MIGRRFLGQNGHGRQHARYVAGQEDDGLRFPGPVFLGAELNMFPGIAGPGVFRQRRVGVIRRARDRIDHDVLDDAAEANGIPDHGLVFPG